MPWWVEGEVMARFGTAASAVIFLFGSMFLWFMPSLLGTGTTVHGAIWSVIQALALATAVAFAGAAWGLDKARRWWKPLAIGGSVLGMIVLLLWWSAVSSVSGVTNVVANLALHAAGVAVVLLVLLIPSPARKLDRLLAAYPTGPP
jgi:hypothetical protein